MDGKNHFIKLLKMKNNKKFDSEKLYRINKSNEELIQLLSPEITVSNQELFYKKSGQQNTFNKELNNKGIYRSNKMAYPELDDCLEKIQQELDILFKQNIGIKKSRLDLDVAKIFHRNLKIAKMAIVDYDFWRYITLFYFIELVKRRWESYPEDPAHWNANAKAICGRALGLTLNKKRYDESKIISYTTRNIRIDCYRYWFIGNKLFDLKKGYYLIDKISDKFKTQDGSLQQFFLELEGSRLLSHGDRIAKIMADAILLSNKRYTEPELEGCFRRYNAYSNRLFMEAEEKMIKKEICLQQV